MQKRLMIGLSALTIATPAFAADLYTPYIPPSDSPVYSPAPMTTVGHLDLGLGFIDIDSSDTYGLANAFGRANIPFGGGMWNFEAEIGGWVIFDGGDTYETLQGIGHLWARLPSAAIGVFGGATAYAGTGVGTVGAEGEAYFGNLTLGAQGSYNWADFGDLWSARGYADFYFNPNLRVGGDVQYFSNGGEAWIFTGEVENRFSGTPVSLGANLSYVTGDIVDAWAGMVTARIFMDGGMTLQDHDRNVPFDFSIPVTLD